MRTVCRSIIPRVLLATVSVVLLGQVAGASTPARADTQRKIALGVNSAGIPEDMGASLDTFTEKTGARPAIAMYYQDWYEGWSTALVNRRFVDQATARGATPMITWEPCLADAQTTDQPAYSLKNIAAGRFDDYIARAAGEAKAFGAPLFVRFAHEMNGTWTSWGLGVNGNTAADYVAAWRHVVSIFRATGASNVQWVWSPNTSGFGVAGFSDMFPGDDWVDWVALDGYNWGSSAGSGWRSLASVFGDSYDTITALTTKPVMIGETAAPEQGGDKAEWIRDGLMNEVTARMPRVRAVMWFDRNKEQDWRVDSSAASLSAFRDVATSSLYSATAQDLLAPTATPPEPATPPTTTSPPPAPDTIPPVVTPPAPPLGPAGPLTVPSPTDTSAPPPAPRRVPSGSGAPGLGTFSVGPTARFTRDAVRVTVRCSDGPCAVRLALRTTGSHGRSLGTVAVDLRSGDRRVLSLRMPAAGRRPLRHGPARALVTLSRHARVIRRVAIVIRP